MRKLETLARDLGDPVAGRRRSRAFLPLGDGDLGLHRPALSVGFILAPHFTLLAFSSFVEALRHARREGIRSREIECRWAVMAPRHEPIASSCGVEVMPTGGYQDPREFDYIVVVGGDLNRGPQQDTEMTAYLRRAAACRVPLVGVCTGSFVLARARLLEGCRCCVHWYRYQAFVDEFPDLTPVTDRLYVVDRDRITCVGGVAVIDLAAHLIEKRFGKDRAHRTLLFMNVDGPRSTNWSPPHFSPGIADARVRKAMLLMEQHVSDPLRIGDVARAVNMSVRQFERVFRATIGASPREYGRISRLKHGGRLLATTRLPVNVIAYECGFADGPHFCRHFKGASGLTPTEFRASGGSKRPWPEEAPRWMQFPTGNAIAPERIGSQQESRKVSR